MQSRVVYTFAWSCQDAQAYVRDGMRLISLVERRVVASASSVTSAPQETVYAYLSDPSSAAGLSSGISAFHIVDVQNRPGGRQVRYTCLAYRRVVIEATVDQVLEPPRRVTARTIQVRFPKGRRAYGILRVRLTEELVWILQPMPDLLSTQVTVEAAWRATWPTFIFGYTGRQALRRMLRSLAGAIRPPYPLRYWHRPGLILLRSAPTSDTDRAPARPGRGTLALTNLVRSDRRGMMRS